MQTLLLIFFTFTLQNVALGYNEPIQKVRDYPKKLHRHLMLNRKYLKPSPERRVFTKKENTDVTYTVFPPIPSSQKGKNLPDSPFFPLPGNMDHKNRVKKMLPDYPWRVAPRRKRSPEKDSKVIEKKIEKPKPKVHKKNDKPKKGVKATSVAKQEDKTTIARLENIKPVTNVTTKAPGKKPALKPKSKNAPGKKSQKNPAKGPAAKASKSKSEKAAPASGKAKQEGKAAKNKKETRRRRPRKLSPSRKYEGGDSRRLTAARDAAIENYPYVVSIQKDGEHWCSGALLNQRLVITTANCVWKSQGLSKMQIRAGSRYVDREGQEAKIQEVMKHPGWSLRKSPDNDVALLFLDRVIKFSHSVHAVDIPNRVMLPIFDDAWVTSYGAERRDGIYERPGMSLQVYHARLIDRDKCNNITQRFGVVVTENFICLAQTGQRAPCTRDTGAPAVSDGVLWGLASWGIRKLCGTERFPAMFSFLASHSNMDFISKATAKLMSEPRPYPFPDRYVAGEALDS